jgi:YggT family protein
VNVLAVNPFIWLISEVITIYTWLLIISVVMSWLVAFNIINTGNRLVYLVGDFLYRITAPLLDPIRRLLPLTGGMDISPVVLILILMFLNRALYFYFG